MTLLTLPFPPGVNNLFSNGKRGRFITPRYAAWKALAAAEIMRQRPKPVAGLFAIKLSMHKPDRRRRDLDGLLKAQLDSLVAAGVIEDDSLAMSILIEWVDDVVRKDQPVRVSIHPWPVSNRIG